MTNDTDASIRREYDRQRGLVIANLNAIASAMMQEREVLLGTDYVPMAHWRSMMKGLEDAQASCEVLRNFYKAE